MSAYVSAHGSIQVEFKALPTQRPPTPPNGDPRTSSILLLFEEFVPREYRDQLAAPKKKGIFAPTALFVASLNPNKSKQWKPAPTLNGKPYVVGNTPSSTTTATKGIKEADFEHMLKSTHATTKVSLTRGISTREQSVPTPLTSNVPLPEDAPPVPPLPLQSPVKNSKGRFKLGRKKSGGIQPAEYDEMDFETREASESDSEDNLSSAGMNGRAGGSKRLSRDDAWIDIRVADTSRRRAPGQDAEPTPAPPVVSRRKGGNRSDPELAREEMAKALAGVPPPSDDDFPFHQQGYHSNGHQPTHIEESLAEPEPYPYSNPVLGGRRSLESDEYTQNDGPVIRVQSPSTIASRNDPRWIGVGHHRESTEGDFEPLPQTLSQEVELPSFIDSERNYSHELIPPQPTSATLPPSPSANQSNLPRLEGSSPGSSPGKKPNVSALVDMYQQKATTPAPSKLPVRTASLDNPKSAAAGSSPPNPAQEPIPGEKDIEIVPAPLDLPAGRISPGRYVHGAPLHNVMEEEEEED